MNYIPLHVHSMFSLLDGLSKPEQIAERCNEIGASACALTDHGNIAGYEKRRHKTYFGL
jgi:DNA polymerase-3 subunit alpha